MTSPRFREYRERIDAKSMTELAEIVAQEASWTRPDEMRNIGNIA